MVIKDSEGISAKLAAVQVEFIEANSPRGWAIQWEVFVRDGQVVSDLCIIMYWQTN
jgi:hypothetical protein